ncbi:30S ribosomal protein S20 [Candidatus Comchoanobacter bicostacola]|uniref:Small ribosomal subunit protein bS20 n=1 Tax=Candidatus Comchoanobacter bicostacola TaxID=2919598 RepID=A0ABY5DJK7_9GAMM|nr:30S ribosomal protein S20 [Candidatus Comchoanobacter bicostacola]UTC24380.1 30S ribosomal protein S20 [Candidatus Comchoanobacter bicostacola]
MANSKQATKRLRQSEKRRTVNKSTKSALLTLLKKFRSNPTVELFRSLQKKMAQASAKNILPQGRANRLIKRAHQRLAS